MYPGTPQTDTNGYKVPITYVKNEKQKQQLQNFLFRFWLKFNPKDGFNQIEKNMVYQTMLNIRIGEKPTTE